jgi:hypothetical protein
MSHRAASRRERKGAMAGPLMDGLAMPPTTAVLSMAK